VLLCLRILVMGRAGFLPRGRAKEAVGRGTGHLGDVRGGEQVRFGLGGVVQRSEHLLSLRILVVGQAWVLPRGRAREAVGRGKRHLIFVREGEPVRFGLGC